MVSAEGPTALPTRPPPDLAARKLRGRALVSVYLLAALSGVDSALLPSSGLIPLGITLLFASAVTIWCIFDSRVVGKPILDSMQWVMVLTWGIAVPVYLVWTRGFRGFGLAVLHAFLLYVTTIVSFVVAGYLRHGSAIFPTAG